jgi:glutathione S-transferase
VPYLIDPNTSRELYESDAIVAYLQREYGKGSAPS